MPQSSCLPTRIRRALTRAALVRQKRAARPFPPLGQSVFVKGQLKVLGKQTPGLPGNTTVGRCVSCVFSVPLY